MSDEKKRWLKQTAAVIKAIVERQEACNFVDLVCDLQDFAATLENMVKYAEMCENV